MNIFVLHNDPKKAARYNCDKHVVKMIVELYQQLGSAVIRHGATPDKMPVTKKGTPLRGGYRHHPCTVWCGNTRANYKWACSHAIELCREYRRRYHRTHSCELGIKLLSKMSQLVPAGKLTTFAMAMPDKYKKEVNPVKAYRAYYMGEKSSFAKWDHSKVPAWWKIDQYEEVAA